MRAVAYDAEGKPVPPGKVIWRSADARIAAVQPEKGEVEGRAPGMTTLTVENEQGLKSEPVLVTVHEATAIKIGNSPPVAVGSNRRAQLNIEVVVAKGQVVKNPALSWQSSDTRVATVSPDGWLVGGEVGDAEVKAFAGVAESGALEVIVDTSGAGKPKQAGQGRPQILLSGQDPCPFDDTSVRLDASDPIVYQRPYKPDHENNVFWLNLQHPMAEALLGAGEHTIQWRTYHFQRIIDVYATLELRREYEDRKDLDVNAILIAAQEHVTEIFAWAKEDNALFDVLYSDSIDLAAL